MEAKANRKKGDAQTKTAIKTSATGHNETFVDRTYRGAHRKGSVRFCSFFKVGGQQQKSLYSAINMTSMLTTALDLAVYNDFLVTGFF